MQFLILLGAYLHYKERVWNTRKGGYSKKKWEDSKEEIGDVWGGVRGRFPCCFGCLLSLLSVPPFLSLFLFSFSGSSGKCKRFSFGIILARLPDVVLRSMVKVVVIWIDVVGDSTTNGKPTLQVRAGWCRSLGFCLRSRHLLSPFRKCTVRRWSCCKKYILQCKRVQVNGGY